MTQVEGKPQLRYAKEIDARCRSGPAKVRQFGQIENTAFWKQTISAARSHAVCRSGWKMETSAAIALKFAAV
jgi:hypothetical protein